MTQRAREALKAYLLGDYEKAGYLYQAAGDQKKALKAFLKARNLKAAAGIEVALGKVLDAAAHLAQAGDKLAAADILAQHRQFVKAAKMYADAGNMIMASGMAQKSGNPAMAAEFEERAGRLFEAGVLWHQAGKADKAILSLEKALSQIPKTGVVNPFDMDEWQQRRSFIARAFEDGKAYARAGEIYHEMGLLEAAAQAFEKAKLYTRAMELYRQLNNVSKVEELLKKAEAPVTLKAEALALKGDSVKAAEAFAQQGAPQKGAPLMENAGDFAAAGRMWREAKEWERAGNAFFRGGAYLSAGECFRQAHLWALASEAYEKAGDREMALKMACEGGEWDRAYGLVSTPEERESLVRLWQAVPSESAEHPMARLMLSRAFVDMGQPKLARECLRDLPPNAGGDNPWVDYMRARVCEELSELQEACTGYHRVLARDLFFRDARQRLGRLESALGPAERTGSRPKSGQPGS